MVYRAFSYATASRSRTAVRVYACGLGPWKREHDLKLPVDAHPCSAPAESALHRLTEAAYTAICIAYMVSAAPP